MSNNRFVNIEKILDQVSYDNIERAVPEVTSEDKSWAKKAKSRLKKATREEMDDEVFAEIKNGNIRRVLWLLHAVKTVNGRERRSASAPERFLSNILRQYPAPLVEQQRQVFETLAIYSYEYAPGCYGNGYIVREAIKNDHLDVLRFYYMDYPPSTDVIECAASEEKPTILDFLLDCYKDKNGSIPTDLCLRLSYQCGNFKLLNRAVSEGQFIAFEQLEYANLSTIAPIFKLDEVVYHEFLQATLQHDDVTPDKMLFYAVMNQEFDHADGLINDYGAVLDNITDDLIDATLATGKEDVVKYLSEKGQDIAKIVKYYNELGKEYSGFTKRLSDLFGDISKKQDLITWEMEDSQTITRTRTTENLETKWIFYFDEEVVLQLTFSKGRGKKQISDSVMEMGTMKNQALIIEAAEKLTELGGEPQYDPAANKATPSVQVLGKANLKSTAG